MAHLLPEAITGRPKFGFTSPIEDWLRESLGAEVERRYADLLDSLYDRD